jgi:hypothetical protein
VIRAAVRRALLWLAARLEPKPDPRIRELELALLAANARADGFAKVAEDVLKQLKASVATTEQLLEAQRAEPEPDDTAAHLREYVDGYAAGKRLRARRGAPS